ncbi:MAG: pitrilysin family protein, partial [Pseudomonadota bacterium]
MKIFKTFAFAFLFFCVASPAYADIKVQRVRSVGGVEAWLVQEKSIPIIAVSFAFVGGGSQDPAGKTGLAQFMTGLLDEGAGAYDAQSFKEKLQALAVSLNFSIDRDAISGSVQTLSANRETAFELLRLALTSPRFDKDAVERVRAQIFSVLRNQTNNIEKQSANAFAAAAFPNHPYGLPTVGTEETVAKLTRDDIVATHQRLIARSNLKISVVGDMTPEELSKVLDNVFGALPEKAVLTDIPEIKMQSAGKRIVVEKSGPQSQIQFGQVAPKRHDADFMPSYLFNHMFGGSTFSSRLYKEIREKRGLTYGVYSDIATLDHAALFVGSMATRNET